MMRRCRSAFCLARNPLISASCHKNRIDSILELVQFFARSHKGKGEHSMSIEFSRSVLKTHLRAATAAAALLLATGAPGRRSQRADLVRSCRPGAAAAVRGGQRRQGQRQGIRRHRRRPGHRRAVAARRLGRDGDRLASTCRAASKRACSSRCRKTSCRSADLFPEVKMDGSTVVDGKRYGITEKFGYNTIGFNKTKVDPADMQSMAVADRRQIQGPASPSTTITCRSSAWRRWPSARRRPS